MDTVVTCGSCELVLDERPDTPAEQRTPCPRCGSLVRTFQTSGSAAVGVHASLAWERYREFSRRHMGWTIINVSIIVASGLLGFVLAGVVGVVVGIVLGTLVYFLVPSGVEKVREIERGRT